MSSNKEGHHKVAFSENQQIDASQNLRIHNDNISKLKLYASILIFILFLICIYLYRQIDLLQKELNKNISQLRYFDVPTVTTGQHVLRYPHSHPLFTFKYPTVGIPVPGNKFNNTLVKDEDLAGFDQIVNNLFKPFNDTDCKYGRIGDQTDGGYIVCQNFIENSQALLNFGVKDQDSFGCDLTANYPMPNYQYDCTTEKAIGCEVNNGANAFSQLCVGEVSQKTSEFTYFTFWDVLKSRNLVKKHIMLKMDTEGGQYLAFKYFPTQFLKYIDQIVMEVHFDQVDPDIWGNLDIFRTLTQHFVPVNYHMNNHACHYENRAPLRRMPARAFEVTLVNKKLVQVKSNSRSFKEHHLNAPNKKGYPDCQMPQ